MMRFAITSTSAGRRKCAIFFILTPDAVCRRMATTHGLQCAVPNLVSPLDRSVMTNFSATSWPSRVGVARNALFAILCLYPTLVYVLAPPVGVAQTTGQNISGPTPWIDVTTFGAKGDAKLNVTGTTTSGSTTLSVSGGSPTSFSSADVGKAVSVNG